jgi:hypothetical protein
MYLNYNNSNIIVLYGESISNIDIFSKKHGEIQQKNPTTWPLQISYGKSLYNILHRCSPQKSPIFRTKNHIARLQSCTMRSCIVEMAFLLHGTLGGAPLPRSPPLRECEDLDWVVRVHSPHLIASPRVPPTLAIAPPSIKQQWYPWLLW